MNDLIRVLIVDNDDSFRHETRLLLKSAEDITVVGEAKDGQTALSMIHTARPDVILLNAGLLHASSPQTATQIHELFTRTKIIVLNKEGQEQLVLDALGRGALGHLSRENARPDEIVAAIHTVSRGKAIVSSGIAGRILDHVLQKHKPDP